MTPLAVGPRRPDLKRTWRRDLDRRTGREDSEAAFWRSLRVLGAVGWPIVVATAGGALLGRWLDARWDTGIHFTLALLVLGAIGGSFVAYRAVRGADR